MTRNGLSSIEKLTAAEVAAFSVEVGLPSFKELHSISPVQTEAIDLVSIRTATGNHIISSLTHSFVVIADEESDFANSEVVPAGLLDVGQKLCVLDLSGAIISDQIIDIGPVAEDHSMYSFDHDEDCFPVIFAGGLGILSG